MVKTNMSPFNVSRAEHFICSAVQHIDHIDPKALFVEYKDLGDDEVYSVAKKNEVVSIVAHAFMTHFPDCYNLPNHWFEKFETIEKRISSYMREMDQLSDHLFQAEIPMVALKNSGIARGLYQNYGACPMGDLDILILPRDFYAAHKIILSLGYQLNFRNPYEENDIDQAFLNGGSEYSIKLDTGELLWLELQWRPIAGRWIRPSQEPKSADLIAHAKAIEGTKVMLLSAEDNLLQVCLHTAKHSFVRAPGFRLHTDVDRIVAGEKIDWNVFLQKVKELKVCTPVYFSLFLASSLLNTSIPDWALKKISPGRFKAYLIVLWLNKVGVFNPNEQKWSNLGYIIFVSLLYDSLTDFFRGIFPSIDEMKDKYPDVNRSNIIFYHFRRIYFLVTRRTGI